MRQIAMETCEIFKQLNRVEFLDHDSGLGGKSFESENHSKVELSCSDSSEEPESTTLVRKETADEPEAEVEESAFSELKACGYVKGSNESHGGLYPRAATAQAFVPTREAGQLDVGSHEARNDSDDTKELGATETGTDVGLGFELFDM